MTTPPTRWHTSVLLPGLVVWTLLTTPNAGTNAWSMTSSQAVTGQDTTSPDRTLTVGQTAPPLALPDSAGRWVTLAAYQGRPVVLNFWATWCEPCRDEMPLFQQAYDRHRGAGLAILGISQDAPDRMQAVRDYWTQAGLTFPTLLDPDSTAAKQYQVFVLPSTIFLNAQGVVTAIHQGPLNATQLRQYLDKTMTSQTSAVASDNDATRG